MWELRAPVQRSTLVQGVGAAAVAVIAPLPSFDRLRTNRVCADKTKGFVLSLSKDGGTRPASAYLRNRTPGPSAGSVPSPAAMKTMPAASKVS